MKYTAWIRLARDFAAGRFRAHEKGSFEGYEQWQHSMRVANLVDKVGGSEEMICAAILHDVVEDTNTTSEEVEREFGPLIAGLVLELTHEGQPDSRGYYFPRLKSRDAIVIKLADRMDNLMRMDKWPKERQQHYLNKTKFWKTE